MKRAICGLMILLVPIVAAGQSSIVDTVHNLSSSGPGPYRSETIDQVC